MRKLRTGVTTGLCAAAAAKAATTLLLSSDHVDLVEIPARNGALLTLGIDVSELENGCAKCTVAKDAGDDPDVTDGVRIVAAVARSDIDGIFVDGGEGVGRVTMPGLKVPVGRAAINPVPMEMIRSAIREVCEEYGYNGGIKAVISIPGGEELAKKTMNGRLGIVGGLSILGTTGIVEPMSDRAIVETIKAEIDVHAASGKSSLIMAPGNYGREFAAAELGVRIDEAVKCSNFIGEALDYACTKGIERITLIGHAGKLVKLAGGIMNTHSSIADCRMEIIAAHAALCGARTQEICQIMESATTEAAIGILDKLGIRGPVWDSIGKKIGFHLAARVRGAASVEYIVFTLEHGVCYRSACSL